MRKLVLAGAGVASLVVGASVSSGPAWSENAPKNCTDAYSSCTSRTHMSKECEAERQWCLKTGTFADPKTKVVASGLQKK